MKLFGALPEIEALLKHTPAFHDVEQLRRLAAENAEASLEEIRKSRDEDKAVWQRERQAMQQKKVGLGESRKRSEEDTAAWQRERQELQGQVSRLREEVLQIMPRCRWRRSTRGARKIRRSGSGRGKRWAM